MVGEPYIASASADRSRTAEANRPPWHAVHRALLPGVQPNVLQRAFRARRARAPAVACACTIGIRMLFPCRGACATPGVLRTRSAATPHTGPGPTVLSPESREATTLWWRSYGRGERRATGGYLERSCSNSKSGYVHHRSADRMTDCTHASPALRAVARPIPASATTFRDGTSLLMTFAAAATFDTCSPAMMVGVES